MKKAELIIGIGAIALLFSSFYPIEFLSIPRVIFISGLSVIYFYFGFALFNDIRLRTIFKRSSYEGISSARIIIAILSGISLSGLAIGLLFKSQLWPGSSTMILIGIFGSCLSSIMALFVFSVKAPKLFRYLLSRLVVGAFTGLAFYLVPRETILELKYKDYPEYVDARKASWADPMNEELMQKAAEERQRMEESRQ